MDFRKIDIKNVLSDMYKLNFLKKCFFAVGIMSDEDDVRPKEKKKIPQLIDINSIMEEFRAVPRMLSPLPFYEVI